MRHDTSEDRGIREHIGGDLVDLDDFLGDIALGLNECRVCLGECSSLDTHRPDLANGIDLGAKPRCFQVENGDGE